jgi:hypothetical protein
MTHVTVFNETTGVPLMTLCINWNFTGTIVNIGGNFEQPAHDSPANADEWASVMGDDG